MTPREQRRAAAHAAKKADGYAAFTKRKYTPTTGNMTSQNKSYLAGKHGTGGVPAKKNDTPVIREFKQFEPYSVRRTSSK